ncbi:hypothetical protein ACLKA6_012881 [Drosophila palustris]
MFLHTLFIAIDNSPVHKTAVDIRNFTTLQENSTAINKTNNKRIPVPDPGVPALPETDTFLRLPQVGPRMDLLFKCWPTCFSLPFSNTKVSRASFHQQVYMYHRINATHKIKTTRRQMRNSGYEYDNFVSDQVLPDASVAAGTPRESQ